MIRALRLAAVALLSCVSAAHADHEGHSPIALRVDPTNPDRLMVGYNRQGGGVLISTDGGDTWSMVCAGAIAPELEGHTGSALSGFQISADGALIVGHFDGIHESPDGCDWNEKPATDGRWIADIVRDPVDRDVFYALAGRTLDNVDNEQEGAVFRRKGGKWKQLGESLALAPGKLLVADLGDGRRRLYMSAVNGRATDTFFGTEVEVPNYVVRYSDDDGESWTEFVMPMVAPLTFFLVAADPTNPNRLLALLSGGFATTDTLLLSRNRGKSFEEFDVLERFGAAVFAPDGRLWWGGIADGLWRADSVLDDKVAVNSAALVQCLEYVGDDLLYMCQPRDVGRIGGVGGNYEMLMDITFLDRTLVCDRSPSICTKCVPALDAHYCTPFGFADAPICALCADNCNEIPSMRQGMPVVKECTQVLPHTTLTREDVEMSVLDTIEDPDAGPESVEGAEEPEFERGAACSCRTAGTPPTGARPPWLIFAAAGLLRMRQRWRP